MASEARPTFSFELHPPRGDAPPESLRETFEALAAAGPEFISVTYGAGGSSRERSLALLRVLLEQTGIQPMAHLTCVGSSGEEAGRLVREFLDAGITSFLALRGDPPAGSDAADDFLGDLRTAAELVQLIHRVRAERAQFETLASRDGAGAGRLPERTDPVRVAVATFPNGHERDRRRDQDIDALLAKQTAGATMALTQLFFDPDDYLAFIERAADAGVAIPIVPGIMPVTTPGQLRKAVELAGGRRPDALAKQLEDAPDADSRARVGIEHAVSLSRRVLDGGAPALHLYTMNHHRPVLALLDELGLTGSRSAGPAVHRTVSTRGVPS